MIFPGFREMSPFRQLLFSGFIILATFLSFTLISLIIAIPVFGIDSLTGLPGINDIDNPESVRILKYFQVIQSISLFIIPSFIIGWFFSEKISEYLYLNRPVTTFSVILTISATILVLPFINFTGELNSNMVLPESLSNIERWMKNAEENAALLTDAFLKTDTTRGMLFNIFMIAFLPAIGEELLFRGVIQKIFTDWTKNHHWGIWITAILFSALHMQFYGFIPRMILGVLFGYLLVWSSSIWLPVIAHFVNNGFAVLAIYLINKNLIDPKVENIGSTPDSYYSALISFFIVCALLMVIKKQCERVLTRQSVN